MCVAVVPVKGGAESKKRLQMLFDAGGRRQLVQAMLEDLLAALSACEMIESIVLFSSAQDIVSLAQKHAVQIHPDPGGGLNRVAHTAAERLSRQGVARMLFIHADLPAVSPEELQSFCREWPPHLGPGVCLAEDRRGRGSNALLCTPPDIIQFHFGDDSARKHVMEARQGNFGVRRCFSPGLSLDLDTPADLREFYRRNTGLPGPAQHTRTFLAQFSQSHLCAIPDAE